MTIVLKKTLALSFLQLLSENKLTLNDYHDVESLKEKLNICPLNKQDTVIGLLNDTVGFSLTEIRVLQSPWLKPSHIATFYDSIYIGKRLINDNSPLVENFFNHFENKFI